MLIFLIQKISLHFLWWLLISPSSMYSIVYKNAYTENFSHTFVSRTWPTNSKREKRPFIYSLITWMKSRSTYFLKIPSVKILSSIRFSFLHWHLFSLWPWDYINHNVVPLPTFSQRILFRPLALIKAVPVHIAFMFMQLFDCNSMFTLNYCTVGWKSAMLLLNRLDVNSVCTKVNELMIHSGDIFSFTCVCINEANVSQISHNSLSVLPYLRKLPIWKINSAVLAVSLEECCII